MSFLSPDFTPIHFPNDTPAVPMHPQPQYPSSDISSSTPSTPASTRSTSSSSSGTKDKHKARIYNQDPKYPADAPHWHSKHNGKCPECHQSGGLTNPKWHSQKKRLFILCRNVTCKYWRFTDYYTDPPTSASSTSTIAGPTPIPAGVTTPCLANPCTKGNKRNRNAACANKMCKEDCIISGRSDCTVHRRAKRDRVSGSTAGRPPPVLFNGPSLPSMPSIPSSAIASSITSSSMVSPLEAALPPSSPNPTNPRSLRDITTSTIRPSLDNPLPRPSASPLEEGPTFQEVRRYARDLPQDWADVIAAQQSAKAQQMLYEANFRSQTKEGISINVVFYRARLGVAPYLFERVVHAGREYSLAEDVDLCTVVGFDPKTVFIITYLGGMWSHRSPRERHQIKPGSFLFFREPGPEVVAYEDTLLRFDELLALSTDPGFGGASTFLSTPASGPQSPVGPRPRPRPKIRPLGLPKVDHRYNWITARNAPFMSTATAGTIEATTEATTEPTPSPSEGLSSTTPSATNSSSSTTLSATNSSVPSGSSNGVPKKDWPDEYTVKEIHDGFMAILNKGRARKGSGITVADRFLEAFPDAKRWISGRYYAVLEKWRSYTVDGNQAARDAFRAWLKTDALWTSIFGADIISPAAKKRKIEMPVFDDLD
ncbi:hypothetical protein M407DRAFT_24505 [Tulasnella calospora MUT 4182]|uniref:Uncharacterized protein n=1 Tax=Tulasnella calospora MUT 4182 TaxID=1051891 RepID=A0A0C3LXI2_9AGAM|nr:hypothetical protein M407DRAFT_24505 [Tulasnella calospora MUT 4182]